MSILERREAATDGATTRILRSRCRDWRDDEGLPVGREDLPTSPVSTVAREARLLNRPHRLFEALLLEETRANCRLPTMR